MKIRTPKGEIKEGSFKVTKMRCWRIMTVAKGMLTSDEFNDTDPEDSANKLELSFEYLMNNQELQWITIISPQAILMSLCLQSIVEELLRVRSGVAIKRVSSLDIPHYYSRDKCDYDIPFFRPVRSLARRNISSKERMVWFKSFQFGVDSIRLNIKTVATATQTFPR